MNEPIIEVDLTAFTQWARQHIEHDYPKAVAECFSDIAKMGRDEGRSLTKNKFKLHSEYIPKGIRHLPQTDAQKNAAARGMKKYGDMSAWVFVRKATDPKKSLMFMVHHEIGEKREAVKRYIAVPTRRMKEKAFRTAKGKVKKRWKPETLLQSYNESGSYFTGKTTRSTNRQRRTGRGRRLPGKPFLIRGYRGDITIVRRLTNFYLILEHLYVLKEDVTIKKEWGLVRGVKEAIMRNYSKVILEHMRRLPSGS